MFQCFGVQLTVLMFVNRNFKVDDDVVYEVSLLLLLLLLNFQSGKYSVQLNPFGLKIKIKFRVELKLT